MTVSSFKRYNYWASNLLFLDLALGQIFAFVAHQRHYDSFIGTRSIIIGYVTAVLLLVLYICIRKGYRWAGILSVILFVITVLSIPFVYTTIFATAFVLVRYAISFFTQLVANVLILKGLQVDKTGEKLLNQID